MNIVLLCAGFGTRLTPVIDDRPKGLVEIAGRPVVEYLLDPILGWPSDTNVHVVTNDRFADQFVSWGRTWEAKHAGQADVTIHNNGVTANADRPGAVADLAWAIDRIGQDKPVVIAASDNIFRFSLDPLWHSFNRSQEPHIAAVRQDDRALLRRTAILELADTGRVEALYEKPDQPSTHWTCPSLYFLPQKVLLFPREYLDQGGQPDALGLMIGALAEESSVYACRVQAPAPTPLRLDIGTPEAYRQAQEILSQEPVLVDSARVQLPVL